nr:MAG TPA: hypothetical protein [Bacteriophage sp.]
MILLGFCAICVLHECYKITCTNFHRHNFVVNIPFLYRPFLFLSGTLRRLVGPCFIADFNPYPP